MSLNSTCLAIHSLHFEGNIIPASWRDHIKFENGKTDPIGMMVLAEIVYWYRLKEVRDPATGEYVGHVERFEGDMLQRSYSGLADALGFTKRQTQDACYRLKLANLIRIELRTIVSNEGVRASNVVFIAPVPERIAEITQPRPRRQRKTSHVITGEGSRSNGRPQPVERETYIEIKEIGENNDDAADAHAPARIDDPDPLVNTPQPDPPSGQQEGQSSLTSHDPADPPFDTTDPDGIDLDRLTGKKAPVNPYTEHELSLAAAIRASGIWNGHYLDRQDTRLRVMQLAKLWAGEGLETEELAGLLKDLKDEGRKPTHVNYIEKPVADYLQAKENPVSATNTGPGHKTNNRRNGEDYGSHRKIHQGPNGYRNRADRIFDQLNCIPGPGFNPSDEDPFIPDDTEF